MKEYQHYTDEELIVRIRDGEKEIADYLIGKYKNLVLKKVHSMYILGGDSDDLIQEGMIGLYKAIRDYDFGRDASFFTFAEICVSRQLFTAVSASQRKKHIPLNNYISLNGFDDNNENGGGENSLVDVLSSLTEKSPEQLMLDRAVIDEIEQVIDNDLSQLEKECIRLYMTGLGISEIAKVLGRDDKSTDNALNRAKQKIKKAVSI